MVSRAKYCEKRLHKLNKRLERIKRKFNGYTNPNKMLEIVTTKINSYNKYLKGKE